MEWHDAVAAVGIFAGLIGIIFVVLPGMALILASVWLWAVVEATRSGWVAAVVVTGIGMAGLFFKYKIAGQRLIDHGLPKSNLLIALAVAFIGFFTIPVLGAFIGFVAATYLLELRRVGSEHAWPASVAALKAIGLSIGIELIAGFLMAAVWLAVVILR